MPNKTVSLCDKSHKIACNMDNFSAWLREELLKYDPEYQKNLENEHKKHAWECMRCDKILWRKDKWAFENCYSCEKPMVYMGHLDRRLYS